MEFATHRGCGSTDDVARTTRRLSDIASMQRGLVRLSNLPKVATALTILLICLTVIMIIQCEFHPANRMHAATGHHQHASSKALDGGFCLIAILPAIWYLPIRFSYTMLVVTILGQRDSHLFPFFIPPRFT